MKKWNFCECEQSNQWNCDFCKEKSKFIKWLESRNSGVVAIVAILTSLIMAIDNIMKWIGML